MQSEIHIKPAHGWRSLKLQEIWQYRELLYLFTLRDVKARYKQTILGPAWAIIQPFMAMVIFSIIFGGLAEIPSNGIPYPIFSFTAMVPWTLFVTSLQNGTQSVWVNSALLRKVYFPRMIFPISSSVSALFDFLIAFAILLGMTLVFGYYPTIKILWIPVFTLLTMATALAASLWFAPLLVLVRDMQLLIIYIVQAWMYISPVVYPLELVPDEWRAVYLMNPMATVIEGFRWAMLDVGEAPEPLSLLGVGVMLLVMISGAFYFKRMEKVFADAS